MTVTPKAILYEYTQQDAPTRGSYGIEPDAEYTCQCCYFEGTVASAKIANVQPTKGHKTIRCGRCNKAITLYVITEKQI